VGTRTRFTCREKVAEAVEEILTRCEVQDWLTVEIGTVEIETFVQTRRGRLGPETQYTRHIATGYRITPRSIRWNGNGRRRGTGSFR
jgi:hypothetical protein